MGVVRGVLDLPSYGLAERVRERRSKSLGPKNRSSRYNSLSALHGCRTGAIAVRNWQDTKRRFHTARRRPTAGSGAQSHRPTAGGIGKTTRRRSPLGIAIRRYASNVALTVPHLAPDEAAESLWVTFVHGSELDVVDNRRPGHTGSLAVVNVFARSQCLREPANCLMQSPWLSPDSRY